jgi:BirA family biotin operon repressor/biotin-[acetyl-CoA-carboxylase] ligase
MSTVFRPVGVDPRLLGRFGLCIAVAVAEAIEASTGVRAKVKWPNDVVVEALNAAPGTICKVGGILIEPTIIATVPACVSHVVVGVGINVNLSAGAMAPVESDALPPIALIDVTGNAVSREELVIQILAATETAALGWADDVWPSWHTRYEARMVWLGGDVVVDADGDPVNRRSGRIVGVDGEGALVITVGSGSVVKIVSGNLRPSVSGLAS